MSRHSIAAYESGRLSPSRVALLTLTRAMVLDATTTNMLLADLGMDPEPSDWARLLCGMPSRTASNWYVQSGAELRPPETIRRDIEAHSWPCLILNDRCDIDAWNPAAVRLFDSDLSDAGKNGTPRNIVGFMARQRMRDRIANWEDVITAVVPAAARRHIAGTVETPAPERLNAAITSIESGDSDVLGRLRDLWSAVPAEPSALRVTFPVIWRHDDGTLLVFNGIISEWSAYERRWAVDWHPADAITWRWLKESR